MAKTKNGRANNKKDNRYFLVFSTVIVFLLVLSGVLTSEVLKQYDHISKYELLEKIDNQACRYLDRQVGVNGGFDLNVDALSNQPKLKYWCLTGDTVAAKEIHGKFIDGYELGASVLYFSSNQEAEKFAAEKINPLRYWGVDEEGQRNGIPQTSRFTFIVNDEKIPYFDAYTVKATAVLRVSLPCGDADVSNGGVACYAEADAILQRELKGINVL